MEGDGKDFETSQPSPQEDSSPGLDILSEENLEASRDTLYQYCQELLDLTRTGKGNLDSKQKALYLSNVFIGLSLLRERPAESRQEMVTLPLSLIFANSKMKEMGLDIKVDEAAAKGVAEKIMKKDLESGQTDIATQAVALQGFQAPISTHLKFAMRLYRESHLK